MPSTDDGQRTPPHILSLDTTLGPPSACLATAKGKIASASAGADVNAADGLMPLLHDLVEAHGGWGLVGLIALAIGPGGFTATRVAVATARALALALPARVLSVGSLEAIATSVGPVPDLAVVKDVKRGEVVLQRFRAGRAVSEPETLTVAATRARLSAVPMPVLCGDGVPLLDLSISTQPPSAGWTGVWADQVWRAACRRLADGDVPQAGSSVRPFYQRAPDAKIAAPLIRFDTAGH